VFFLPDLLGVAAHSYLRRNVAALALEDITDIKKMYRKRNGQGWLGKKGLQVKL
jgi:hypothetical protein